MTKLEFMKELESLLPDIPLEERNEALQYYNGYFEDAGEEHEDEVMKDLGSPSKVAAIIKADLNSNAAERENRGYFTERGYQDTIYNEVKYEVVDAAEMKKEQQEQTNNTNNNSSNANGTYNSKSGYQSNSNYTNGAAGQSAYYNKNSNNKNQNTGLYLIIGIFTFPIWFPLLMSAFGIAIGIFATIFGLIFGFGAAGIAMIVAGIVCFIAGLVQISIPFVGVLLIGGGLIILGLGMLFTLGSIMLCKTVLPALIKGIVNLCRLPFKNRGVMA